MVSSSFSDNKLYISPGDLIMVLTTRLSLHKPASGSENFGDYFPTQYAADLQKIDDMMQIKLIAAAGKIPSTTNTASW